MKDIINHPVLVLNSHRHPIDVTRASHAVSLLMEDSAYALDGGVRYDWKHWFAMAPRELVLRSPSVQVNIPAVIVCPERKDVHWHRPALTRRNLWVRDGGVCQYRGVRLARPNGNMDHVIPESRGGETSWENCVLCDSELNTWKAARRPEECGLRLLKAPMAPAPTPIPYPYFDGSMPGTWLPYMHRFLSAA